MPKRALVLSGGGARGAFQAGALEHILGDLEIDYDIVTGSSVGALNASIVAMFKSGDSKLAADYLSKVWQRVDDRFVYDRWLFGELASLWRPSVYDSRPLHQKIESHVDPRLLKLSGKKLSVGAVSLTNGQYRTWQEDDEDILDAIKASSAFPGMLLPVDIDGEQWVDGGLREIAPVSDAIDLGATHLDVVLTHPQQLPRFTGAKNVIQMLPRVVETILSETTSNDLEMVKLYNRLLKHEEIDKRHIELNVLAPEQVLVENPLDFDADKIRRNMNTGYHAALQMHWT